MTDIGDQLQADHAAILGLIAAWAADPQGEDACGRFIDIIDHLTVHARFVDMAVAPLITPSPAMESPLPRRLGQLHHSIMIMLDALRQAVFKGQVWAMHLGILTDVVCPHLVLRDELLLARLNRILPAIQRAALGQIFRKIKDEVTLALRQTRGRVQALATVAGGGPPPAGRRTGFYPAHHPELAPRREASPGPGRSAADWRRGPGSLRA